MRMRNCESVSPTTENEHDSAIARSELESRNQQLDNENERLRVANMQISELEQQNVRHLLSSQEIMTIGQNHARTPGLTVQALWERIRQLEVMNSGLRGSYQASLGRI